MNRERFVGLVRESLLSLCKNGMPDWMKIQSVEGLIGITLQNKEVFLINIKDELLPSDELDINLPQQPGIGSEASPELTPPLKRKHSSIWTSQKTEGTHINVKRQQSTSVEEDVDNNPTLTSPFGRQHCTTAEGGFDRLTEKLIEIKAEPHSPSSADESSTVEMDQDSGDIPNQERAKAPRLHKHTPIPGHPILSPAIPRLSLPSYVAALRADTQQEDNLPTAIIEHPKPDVQDYLGVFFSGQSQNSYGSQEEGANLVKAHVGPWDCKSPNCKYSSKRKYNLERHIRLVHQGIREECDECGKRFSDVTALRLHKDMYHTSQDLQCGPCNLVFVSSQMQEEHRATCKHQAYSREDIYECGDKLPDTSITFHPETEEPVNGGLNKEQTVICAECSLTFIDKNDLDSHVRQQHPSQAFPCNTCGDVFSSKETLDQHCEACVDLTTH